MGNRSMTVLVSAGLLLAGAKVLADDVHYYEQNGITYREVRRTIEERVPETTLQQCARTVYRERATTETRDTLRTCWAPVTEYRWQARWVNCPSPFAPPYQVLEYVPCIRWQCRTEVARVPVQCSRLVPETEMVQTPVTTYRTVRRDVVNRVAVSGLYAQPILARSPTAPLDYARVARREEIGGLSRYENDPPRYGMQPAWQPGPTTR